MDHFTIRQATASDKEDVIRIHDNVYDGRDYIAEYYDDFISCPLTTPYVASIDGKIVGFVATFVVDEGKTVVTRAGRMSPSVSGQGLYKQLQSHVLQASGVHTHALIAVNANPGTKKESFNTINTHILTKPFVRFIFNARCLNSLVDETRILKTPTHDDLRSYFAADDVKSYLFPRNRIVIDWVPYKPIFANIPLLRWSCRRTKVYSDISVSTERRVHGLLTFSTTLQVKNPAFACNLDIYGTDTTTLKDHVISHIRHIQDMTEGVTSLLVFVEPEFNMLELEKAFGEIGLQKSDWCESGHPERIYSEQLLFEKQI